MDLESTVESFFRDEVDRALRAEGLTSGTMVEYYLVQLLSAYSAQPIPRAPLALEMLTAVESPPRERRAQLRQVGDTSLYVSGFWAESLSDKPIDVDYYIEMGCIAYAELARGGAAWTGDPFGDVFAELASKFPRFVEVLSAISLRTSPCASNRDVLRLYRRWKRTNSRAAAAQLVVLGVVPPRGDGGGPQ